MDGYIFADPIRNQFKRVRILLFEILLLLFNSFSAVDDHR